MFTGVQNLKEFGIIMMAICVETLGHIFSISVSKIMYKCLLGRNIRKPQQVILVA